ncbi:pentapeptide repeat-containing protein [Micromonospora peucetia]|uniref:pentapeptide repeat-containing protein n=1 Tax=Micromonospora peucetia TaxID=47871 RepID=UPI0022526881|nr:pentapeptide repeat-containing protein [Micromonospora peucetia]MCX4388986.1 pentapeptide repeat-containing protein [Micromonospora peucetia]
MPVVQPERQSRVQVVFQGVTALTAVAALLFTAQSLVYTADATRATRAQIDLAARGQIADRFNRAIDQLGQTGLDKLSVRLGGIYSLERIMRDSPEDEPTVIAVLSAFLRTNARRKAEPVRSADPLKSPKPPPAAPEDVRAAFAVLARRPHPEHEQNRRLDLAGTQLSLPEISLPHASLRDANLRDADLSFSDLTNADLSSADLVGIYLNGANLSGANLAGSYMPYAKLSVAILDGANLTNTTLGFAYLGGADLGGADLRDADLSGADLGDADLSNANLTGADLRGADLNEANLTAANLTGARLDDADLINTNLTGTHLTGADLSGADLDGADLSGVTGLTSEAVRCSRMGERTRLPTGVTRPSDVPVSKRPFC